MKLDNKGVLLLATAGVLLTLGAYYIGSRQATAPRPAAGDAAATAAPQRLAPPPRVDPDAPLPPSHPPMPGRSGATAQGPAAVDGRYTHFRVGNRNVKAIFADGDVVWVGTSGGVVRYDLKSGEHRLFDNRSGLLSNGIFHIGKLQGRLVVGTYGGGMSLYDAERDLWRHYNIQHGLADAFVYDVLEADNGDVWVATWSGANRIRGGALDDRSQWDTFTVANTDGGLPNDWVYGLAMGADGEIWLATEGGLTRYRDGEWTNWQHEDGLGAPYEKVRASIEYRNDPAQFSSHHARQKVEQGLEQVDVAYNPNYIVSLAVAPDGVVWAGTWGGGLARFDGEHWSNFTVEEGLPSNHVFMLRFDEQGRLWIGTSKGLARRAADGSFRVMTRQDGLFSDNVFSMDKASDGSLWIGSFGGVARIFPEED